LLTVADVSYIPRNIENTCRIRRRRFSRVHILMIAHFRVCTFLISWPFIQTSSKRSQTTGKRSVGSRKPSTIVREIVARLVSHLSKYVIIISLEGSFTFTIIDHGASPYSSSSAGRGNNLATSFKRRKNPSSTIEIPTKPFFETTPSSSAREQISPSEHPIFLYMSFATSTTVWTNSFPTTNF
jgi:hypothetical protein